MIEAGIAASGRDWGLMCLASRGQLGLVDQEIETPILNAQPDPIAVSHQTQRSASSGFRGDMQDDRAKSRAAHSGIRNADHVLHTRPGELRWDRQIPRFGHACAALRTGILQDEDVVRLDVEIGIVYPQGEILKAREHDGASLMFEQSGIGRGAFQNRAAGCKAAEQGNQSALWLKRLVQRCHDAEIRRFCFACKTLRERFASPRISYRDQVGAAGP